MAFRQDSQYSERAVEWVRRGLTNTKWSVEANEGLVLKRLQAGMTAGDIAQLVHQMGEAGQLVVSPHYERLFLEFYAEKPQYHLACNEQILVDALISEGLGLNVENLAYVAGIPSVAERLAVTESYAAAQRAEQREVVRIERERIESEQIREELLGYLVNGPRKAMLEKAGAHPVVFQKEVRDETQKLANMNHAELVQLITERREKRRIKNLDPKEYRAEVAISRAAGQEPTLQPKMTQALNQYEEIPAIYKTRHGLEVEMTRKGLIELANRDSFSFRECVRRFGAESINDILSGRRA